MGATPALRGATPAPTGSMAADADGCHYMCSCRVRHNFFVHSVGAHFSYDGDDVKFRQSYGADWQATHGSEVPLAAALEDVKRQREERLRAPREAEARLARIAAEYRPQRPEAYRLQPEAFLAAGFRELVGGLRACGRPSEVAACVAGCRERGLLAEVRQGLWTFEVFTEAFCDLLEEELGSFYASGLPNTAPNTMNRKGIILKELGFGPGLLDPLVREHVDVLAGSLLPMCTDGLDSYRAFTVLYDFSEDGDRDLATHYDNAEVTLNVNIGGSWEGGQVEFFGSVMEAKSHSNPEPVAVSVRRGHAILHAGQDLHRATPITSGRRHNLIVWCRSSGVRNDTCPMCMSQPRVVPTTALFDEGFTVPPCELVSALLEGDDDLYS